MELSRLLRDYKDDSRQKLAICSEGPIASSGMAPHLTRHCKEGIDSYSKSQVIKGTKTVRSPQTLQRQSRAMTAGLHSGDLSA
jgi:hypothetical protein